MSVHVLAGHLHSLHHLPHWKRLWEFYLLYTLTTNNIQMLDVHIYRFWWKMRGHLTWYTDVWVPSLSFTFAQIWLIYILVCCYLRETAFLQFILADWDDHYFINYSVIQCSGALRLSVTAFKSLLIWPWAEWVCSDRAYASLSSSFMACIKK